MIWQSYPVVFGCYQGTSLFPSRIIRWFSWSDYSHVAIYRRDRPAGKQIVEAWPKGGVQYARNWTEHHTPGTRVDLFAYPVAISPSRLVLANEWLDDQVGKKYDWRGVIRFMFRAGGAEDGNWFCSELAAEYADRLGHPLQQKPPFKIMPCEVAESAALYGVTTN